MNKLTIINSSISTLLSNNSKARIQLVSGDLNSLSLSNSNIELNGSFNCPIVAINGCSIFLSENFSNASSFTVKNSKNKDVILDNLSIYPLTLYLNPNVNLLISSINKEPTINLVEAASLSDIFFIGNFNKESEKLNVNAPAKGTLYIDANINSLDFFKSKNLILNINPNTEILNFNSIKEDTFKSISCDIATLNLLNSIANIALPFKSIFSYVTVENGLGFLNVNKSYSTIFHTNIILNSEKYLVTSL